MRRTRGTRDQEARLGALSEAEHVERPHERRLDCFDSVELIVRWRCRACEVVNFCFDFMSSWSKRSQAVNGLTIALNHEGLYDVMADHLKVGVAAPMSDGGLGTGEEVIEHGDLMAKKHQAIDQMGADEACAAGDKNALALVGRDELNGGKAGEGGVGD